LVFKGLKSFVTTDNTNN